MVCDAGGMHMRNIKLWIAAAVIMLALICEGAASADIGSNNCGAEGSNVTWTLNSEGVLSITGTGEMAGFSKYDGLSTSAPWDSRRNEIKSVIISDGVTSIGDYAFPYCGNLTSIVIPDSVTSINYSTFRNCSSLTSIVIPGSVTSIGSEVFLGCSSLTSITIPNSVTSIGSSAIPSSALIYCYADSYAETWVKENGMGDNVRYLSDAAIIASGDCGENGDNVTWALDSEGVLSITGTGAMKNYDYDEDYNYDYDLSAPTTPWKNYLR